MSLTTIPSLPAPFAILRSYRKPSAQHAWNSSQGAFEKTLDDAESHCCADSGWACGPHAEALTG